MPFDFAMYLIKADDCGGDDVTKQTVSDVNNNDEKTLMTSQPITCTPGKSYPKRFCDRSPVNVFSFSRAHIFNREIASLREDLESLKLELNDTTEKGGENVVCKSTNNGMHYFQGVINGSTGITAKTNGGSIDNEGGNKGNNGAFTAMLTDFNQTLEAEGHDDATCYFAHCHSCKGPRRALSLDSMKFRHRVRRKVTFADDNGMPLTKIRVMPIEANEKASSLDIYGVHGRYKQLRLDFPQPAADFSTFMECLRKQNVSLENVKTDGTSFLGTVRVKNLALEKDVRMRFTTDNWSTWTDIVASYVYEDATSCYDLFGFHVSVGHLPNEVEFAICYKVREAEHWDNNKGQNYKLKMTSH